MSISKYIDKVKVVLGGMGISNVEDTIICCMCEIETCYTDNISVKDCCKEILLYKKY